MLAGRGVTSQAGNRACTLEGHATTLSRLESRGQPLDTKACPVNAACSGNLQNFSACYILTL